MPPRISRRISGSVSRARRYEEAAGVWSRAVEITPRSSAAWFELSVARLAQGLDAEADAAFRQAQRLDSDPSLFRNRVYRLFDSGGDAALLRDADTFIRLAGWGNESSPYVAFVAALTCWRTKDAAAADALLARAAASVDPESWTAAVAGFLRGKATPEALLRRARHIGEETEAHAYIGLKAAVLGRVTRHFRTWPGSSNAAARATWSTRSRRRSWSG